MWELIQNGGPVMWPLLACSLVVVTVIGERLLFWAQIKRKRNRKLMDEILYLAESGDWQQIKEKTRDCEDHVIRVLNVGILHHRYDMAKAMESEAQQMVKKMSQFMTVLDTMITVAPLLGIFGTVLGIISSFKMLGVGGIADPKLVTGGIAQALITTATGLGISIITVFPYNYFKSRIEHAIHIMENTPPAWRLYFKKYGQGKRMKLSRKTITPPRIEMLPLIDVVFLLLVFFIYAFVSMAVHRGQPVDLPQSSSAALETQKAISVTIQSGGQAKVFVDEEAVNLSSLSERLRRKKTERQDTQEPEVQIFADKSVSYQELFQVLDLVRLAGLTRISLQAEPEGNTP